MDRDELLALPMTRAVMSTVGHAAAWTVNDVTQGAFPRHKVPVLGERLMRDLLAMPEAMRAHLAAALMEGNREPMRLFGAEAEAAPAVPNEAELRKMMGDPRYWRDREPAFVRRVTAGFRALVEAPQ